MMTLNELFRRAREGEANGCVMIDNDSWTYLNPDGGQQYDIDITQPALLALLTSYGIRWEHV